MLVEVWQAQVSSHKYWVKPGTLEKQRYEVHTERVYDHPNELHTYGMN